MYVLLNNFVTCLIISSLLTFIAAVIAWRRSVPGMVSLTLLLVAMGIWSGSYALEWLPIPTHIKHFLPNITYVGVVAVPNLFLIFALTFTNYEKFLTKRLILGLSIQPLVTLFLVWTNQYHRLVFTSISYTIQNGFTLPKFVPGSWYQVNLVYSYLIISVGIAALLVGYVRAHAAARRQYAFTLIAAAFPWVGNMLAEHYLVNVPFDITGATFGLSALLFTYSVMRDRFLDIISVARSRLIESMSDGVLVVDMQNRILDINPAMQRLLNQSPASFVGRSAKEVLAAWLEQDASVLDGEKTHTELQIPHAPSRYLDLRITPLFDRHHHTKGRLMVFRDVTDRKQVERKLRLANERLQSQLIEIGTLQSKLRAQAVRDPLTNLFNRRYLDETLDRELARAAREKYPVCVIMMDLDHFKQVNDTYGHEAGDHVLKALAGALTTQNRRGDFACRFGGEEFVVVMPNIAVDVAFQRAEQLRERLNALQIPYGKHRLNTSISMGISSYPANGEERESVLRAADRAMYAAKKAGRNHILTYDKLEEKRHTLKN